VEVPSGVETIEDDAFGECFSLSSIIIPDNVTEIGARSFSGCRSLTSFTIPPKITTIEEGTFSDCSSLTSVTIPESVSTIERYAFSGCSSLLSVNYLGTSSPVCQRQSLSGSVIELACVPVNSTGSSFCALNFTCKSSSCDNFEHRHNRCYEVISCDGDTEIVRQREFAFMWENHASGCVEYKCDNESGNILKNKCNDGRNTICMNDKCVEPDMVNDQTRARMEVSFEGLGMDEYNSSEIAFLLSEMSEGKLFIRESDIGSELDENGQILRMFIMVDDEETAANVAKTLNAMNKETDCGLGVFCRSTIARIQLKAALSLSGVKSIHNTTAFILIAYIMMMTMMNCVVSV